MQAGEDVNCALRVDYDRRRLPGVVEHTKSTSGCCAGALYSLEPCEDKGLMRAYLHADAKCKNKKTGLCCWENCPNDWGESHNGSEDDDAPLCLCAGYRKASVDHGGVSGKYPKTFLSPSKREQKVEALRLSLAIAASLKPSADGSLPPGDPDPNQNQQGGQETKAALMAGRHEVKPEEREDWQSPGGPQTLGRNPPEGRDRAGVPYGGTPVSDPRCRSLDGRDLPVWITGERLGYAFGVEAGPGEFLFVARCTGETEYIISAGGVQKPSIELYFRYFDRVLMVTPSEAASQLARSVYPESATSGTIGRSAVSSYNGSENPATSSSCGPCHALVLPSVHSGPCAHKTMTVSCP